MSDLLRQALILDTETLGLRRGAGMHELAFMDLQTQHLQSFVLRPNAVSVQTVPQEHTRLAGSSADRYTGHRFDNWMQALHFEVEQQAGHAVPAGQTMAMLKEQQPWLYAQLKHHPHLLGASKEQQQLQNAQRVQRLSKIGVKANLGKQVTVETALGALRQAMSGRTVWIANAAFEAKQVGAQLGAAGPEAWEQFKNQLETRNPDSPDPFYVTGSEVTRARTLAQQTGDWTGVWRAYTTHLPKAGETAVRDIQDVTRALHSYGQQLGFTSKDLNYLGTGVDISHRLHALAAGDVQRLGWKETHRAAEDVAVHEQYVLRKNVQLTTALQQVAEGTEEGARILQQGAEGPLGHVARYFQALEDHGPTLVREQATKRLQRAQQDILKQGYTMQRQGGMPFVQSQLTPDGEFARAWRMQSSRRRMSSMDEVLEHLRTEGRYSAFDVDVQDVWDRMKPHAGTVKELDAYAGAEVKSLQGAWNTIQVGAEHARLDRVLRGPRSAVGSELLQLGAKAVQGRPGAVLGTMAALAGAGAVVGTFQQPQAPAPSLLHYGYDDWVERQRLEGMSEGPVAREGRHRFTDFGSPYQGPVGVQQVFIDQEMLRQRERWLRAQYGARHVRQGPPSLPGWDQVRPGGYDFIPGGTRVRGQDYAMRGQLMKVDLDDGWKISVDDADTVTLKRAGLRGAVQSFFGQNRGYSFRLAGLDAPETPHGGRAAQPWALEAKAAFAKMVHGSENLQVVFDPSQTTYGRQLGAVYADGRNLNIELVKRGLASHLPYGKSRDAIIDYRMLEEAESRAYQGKRGMWSQPWAQAFYEHSAASGNRVTFNTLAKVESVVKNSGTMQMISAMEQAQADGRFSMTEQALARELGGKYNVGDDKVGPWSMSAASTPSTSYLQEQLQDLAGFIRTKGVGGKQNKFSSRGQYGKLDQSMVMDTLGTSDNIWTRRRQAAFGQYRSGKALDRARKSRMAFTQRRTLQALNSSPIGHTRM